MITGKLTSRTIRAARSRPGKLGDGGGLWLQTKPGGAQYWIFRYMLLGRSREMGLGSAELISLSKARTMARAAREQVKAGIDPVSERRKFRDGIPTFHDAWSKYVADHEAAWRNAKHRYQWRATLGQYADPVFGDRPVDLVDAGDVIKALEPIWNSKTETAIRLRGRIEKILDWAKVRGYRDGDNPAAWRGNLEAVFPAPGKIHKVQHLRALPYSRVAAFLVDLKKCKGTAARALELVIMTAARPGMVRLAHWQEFDLEKAVWIVPSNHMKNNQKFRIPLSRQAVALLRSIPTLEDCPLVFPSGRKKPQSDMAMTVLLRRMKVPVTAHGFRSTFKDWSVESTTYPNILSEAALAHVVADKTEAAYRRGDLFDKRRNLMNEWANYCDHVQTAKSGSVVGIGAGR